MIERIHERNILSRLGKGKAIILLGARQTGKTTLLKKMFEEKKAVLWLNADEPDVQSLFSNISSTRLKILFEKYHTIIIDEAQRIFDVGLKLKLITDNLPEKQLIATGSSAFELSGKIKESLTGRKWEFYLYPLSFQEMVAHNGLLEEERLLHHRLIYGYYPDVVSSPGDEKEILFQLADSYLYKDILMWEGIKKPEKLIKLLQALSLQLGNEVSYNELGKMISLDNETIEKYIQLLEQSFVIFRLPSLSRNQRTELKKSRKIYFYDNGIRNALIANFNLPEMRQDIGALWENFLITERMKSLHYNNYHANRFFWRTHSQQEIDYIEEKDGKLYGFEFKWSPTKKARFPKTFTNSYPDSINEVISQENYGNFIMM